MTLSLRTAGDVTATLMYDEPGASMIGRQVGAYQILSLLGTGGMGETMRR